MDQISFIFTLQFMLLGPIKLIPSFAGVTRGADVAFKRSVAIRAVVIAALFMPGATDVACAQVVEDRRELERRRLVDVPDWIGVEIACHDHIARKAPGEVSQAAIDRRDIVTAQG